MPSTLPVVFLDEENFRYVRPWYSSKQTRIFGFRGPVLNLFTSYLSMRSQYTSVKGVNSHLQEMKCGVPQGSVSGPLLFLLYVNDISDNVNSSLTLFADDTNIFEDLKPGSHKLNLMRLWCLSTLWWKVISLIVIRRNRKLFFLEGNHNKCWLIYKV